MSTVDLHTKCLVACDQCKRQYDAKGLAAKSRFHCNCGNVLEVPVFRGHDAEVVRCTSCGAARTADAESCRFCGADYTLHERDLQTICPSCMTRVSDRARYCHHCATPIVSSGDVGEATDRRCPVCGLKKTLRSREFGKAAIALLECDQCAGIWLDREAFATLAEKARIEAVPEMVGAAVASADPSKRQKGPLYRRCPRCREVMNRRNFGRRSGVIVDDCREHGTWFDAHELDTILRWIRRGGEEKSSRRDELETQERERSKKFSAGLEERRRAQQSSGGDGGASGLGGVGEMIKLLFEL